MCRASSQQDSIAAFERTVRAAFSWQRLVVINGITKSFQ
jgi:hypothetical protein